MKSSLESIASILEKIGYIHQNIKHFPSTQRALEDAMTVRPAVLMLLVGISEQLDRIQRKYPNDILSYFTPEEQKGIRDIRNFIAHDYDGVDLPIVEWLIDEALPIIEAKCNLILKEHP
jgi:uncharacterized protein with HEPN domain